MMMRWTRIALSTLLLWALLPATLSTQSSDGDDLTFFEASDQVMNAATDEARRTLPLFLDYVLAQDGAALAGTLKVAFQTFPVDVGEEIIWVDGFRRLPDGSFTGRLSNSPVYLGNWQVGTEVSFPESDIRDWGLRSTDGRLFGNYTTRVIAAQPGNEGLWDVLTPTPLPQGWE